MANPFTIPYLALQEASPTIEVISAGMDTLARQSLKYAPWAQESANLPTVDFAIAHHSTAILLKYYVHEQEIRAMYHKLNDPVYEDSCVECFISFDDDASYYNLEFNCAGTARVEYGPSRHERTFISPKLLEDIRFHVCVQNETPTGISWSITLYLPLTIFDFHRELVLEESKARVNFYKCGDALPEPHFLCWSNIEATNPDFHLPAFFKDAIFKTQANHKPINTRMDHHPA